MKNSLIILLFASLSIFSCKKETEVITPDYSNTVIGNYAVARLELNGKIAILPANGVSAGVSVVIITKNKVKSTLTVQSQTGKVVYNFLASDLRKDDYGTSINFENPSLGSYDPTGKKLILSGITESGETVKIIAYN